MAHADSIAQLLSRLDDTRPLLHQRWPTPTSWAFSAAVRQVSGAEAEANLRRTGRQLLTLHTFAKRPIVAVAGMLNAGKTSLVARFLSEQGRARAPRGLRVAAGTQRFVLWLPHSWQQDAELWQAVQAHVHEVFGAPPELLHTDPQQAHAQYGGAGAVLAHFGVPLLATDPKLDNLGLAFLDCPDVQRPHGDKSGSMMGSVRLSALGRAARLCSAFFVVSTLDSVQDRMLPAILEELAHRAPGVRRYLLLNKLRPDVRPDQVLEEVADICLEHDISAVFGAWDFAIKGYEQWAPAASNDTGSDAEESPRFFELTPEASPQNAHNHLLENVAAQLPIGELYSDKTRSLCTTFKHEMRQALQQVSSAASQSHTRIANAQDGVLSACCQTLLDRDKNLRVPVDRNFLDAFLASIERTAPVYVRFFMWMNRPLRAISRTAKEGLQAAIQTVRPLQATRDRFMSGKHGVIVDAKELASALKGADVDHLVGPLVDVQQAASEALRRFGAQHRSDPNPSELDLATQALWDAMPTWRKAAAAATMMGTLAVGLAAVALIPIDWGSSVIFAASVKEIIAATVTGGVVGMATEVPLRKALEHQAGWPAFSDLRAVLCDVLGLPRARSDGQPWQVEAATQSVRLPEPQVRASAPAENALPLLEVEPTIYDELQEDQ